MIDNLFLHYPITLGLWHRIFTQVGMKWVPLDNICDMVVISLKHFGMLLEVGLFGGLRVSLCCGLCGERGMQGFFRTLGGC